MSDKPGTTTTGTKQDTARINSEKTQKINEIKVIQQEEVKDKTKSNPCCGSCT
ncbi:MAG: hypothetical protein HND59_13065 [Pseudomonadota bacterium]|nr:MAG: hypothetical protein HND59_13065 [Pseudomonadota bacterium]